jgi:hypothetical protein
MELMIGEIFLKALVLCGILFLVARCETSSGFRKLVLVACAITLGSFATEVFLPPALANGDVEGALTSPAVPPQEESVEPLPPEQPADELPAFARTPEWQAAQAKIKVSAVLVERDGSNTAIVNGEVLGIGDILTVEVKRKLYRFKMAELTTDWVAWDPLGETDAD